MDNRSQKLLARQGCNIVLNGFGESGRIEALLRQLKTEYDIHAVYHGADLTRPAEIPALIWSATTAFGVVDILVNKLAVRHFAPVDTFPVECWDEALAVNLSAAFHTVRLALPKMRERNWDRIINMSSGHGFFATANRMDHVTTNTALIGLTRAVAVETARYDITCNTLCPGPVRTPAIETRFQELAAAEGVTRDEAVTRYLAARQPSGRFISGENVGAFIAFLCSPAGSDISGGLFV